jgi:hypothetical protein
MNTTIDSHKDSSAKTRWHRLLGSVLEQLLTPVGMTVYTDVPVMSDPPEADIVLLRRDTRTWTKAQLARLADGLRQTHASHLLIEFKYTESVNEEALLQTLCYDTFYKRAKHLKAAAVQSFLVSSQTPQADTLTHWGYEETEHPGVYHTDDKIFGRIILLSLNQLADEPHNAFLKCFASRPAEKRKAFTTLVGSWVGILTDKLGDLIAGLQKCWHSLIGEELMKQALTPEKVMKIGANWLKAQLAHLPAEERLKGLKPAERLKGLKPAERLKGLKPEEVFSQYAPRERLKGLKPEEILDQLDPAQIEEYLRQAKRKKARSQKT